MNKLILKTALITALSIPSIVNASETKGLNVLVTSADSQTQAMAMVLSLMTIKKHKKEVNMVLCGSAGDLANTEIMGIPVKRPNGSTPSAKDHLKSLIKLGANISVCPLYLPNISKDKSILIDGITVAKPPVVAGQLLDQNYKNINF